MIKSTRKTLIRIRAAFVLLVILGVSYVNGQEILDQKEAERVYRQSIIEQKNNKQYYDQRRECSRLLSEEKYKQAEASCKLSITYAEKLPERSYMERSIANVSTGIALLRQSRAENALAYFMKGLEVATPVLDDTSIETGEIYFLIAQSHHMLGNVKDARDYYDLTEKVVLAAFTSMGEETDDLRSRYPTIIMSALDSHMILLESAGLEKDAENVKAKIAGYRQKFAKYLEN